MTGTDAATARAGRLRERLRAAGLDAFIATSPQARRYLAGLTSGGLPRFRALLVGADALGIVGPAADPSGQPAQLGIAHHRHWQPGDDPLIALADLVQELALGDGTIGVEEGHLTMLERDRLGQLLPEARLAYAGTELDRMRLVKDEDELAAIRAGAASLVTATTQVLESAGRGVTELELQTRLVLALKDLGAGSIRALVLYGSHSARPGAAPTTRALQAGDVILIDVAATCAGYWADISRCASLGTPDAGLVELWDVLGRAQRVVIEALRPGLDGRSVDAVARGLMRDAGHEEKIRHLTGHGIGLDVHEPPFLEPSSTDVLVAGSVLTVEPGLYVDEAVGLRREDDVQLTAAGARVLSPSQSDLIVI
ncbi:MAG: M24 family metallopeptidase [Gaiellales bacterium]